MHKFVRQLLTEWRKLALPFAGETFVVAVSGGADSVSLAAALHELRKLKKLDLRLVLAHFNHDLRAAESDADELFVKNFAARFEFELVCGKPENPASKIENQAGNLEQNARRARYDFLGETAGNLRAYGVLTAHTLNDQAETFLLNLMRGSGLAGLGGMRAVREFEINIGSGGGDEEEGKRGDEESRRKGAEKIYDTVNNLSDFSIPSVSSSPRLLLARPLLHWAARAGTENFCIENRIEFRCDSTNENLAFRRVRIRKVLLPMLADFNPKIVETLANTASRLREDFAELEKAANSTFENFTKKKAGGSGGGENILELKELKNLFPSMRRQILRQWLKTCRGDLRRLDSKHLAAIENLISGGKSGRRVQLPNGEAIVKSGGRLSFEKTAVEKSRADNYNQTSAGEKVRAAIENND